MNESIDDNSINISIQDFLNHIKLSSKIPKIIKEIAKHQIIELSAKKAGINVEVEELQQAADNFRIDNNLYDIEETWSWLQKHYLSLDDFEAIVHANALAKKLAQHLFADKADSWFYEHQLDYAGAVLYEVILKEEDIAMELFCSLQEREICFHEIARQYINEPSLRRAGGYLGIVNRTELKPEISAAVFDASPPEILKPIKTHKGNHLILVEEIIQPELNEKLRSKIIADLFTAWMKKKIKNLEINTHLRDFIST